PPFVVFVDGSLLFDTNFTYGGPGSGMVFVVKGDVNIEKAVTRVDAVIISEGTICTSYDKVGNSCSDSNVPLLINGSLISLNQAKPILFRRRLADNSLPAEKIVWQPKYLVILKDLFADTYQKWSEIQ
ncbi:hypothetical protein HYU96_02455, partial [Candidatus Daviesbacteria bacterium]|nr:hypothetical protein [Candidatus Daviesbacteria bacterium]